MTQTPELAKEPLFEIMSLEGKECQNAQYSWHRFPKTRLKDSPYPDSRPTRQSFMVVSRTKKPKVALFCYHCFLSFLGKCIMDWRKAGATDEEINSYIPAPYYTQTQEDRDKVLGKN